jgi:hypothetical protein
VPDNNPAHRCYSYFLIAAGFLVASFPSFDSDSGSGSGFARLADRLRLDFLRLSLYYS